MPRQRDAEAPGLPLGAAAQPEPASTETETPADEAAGQEEGGELIAGPDATLEEVGQIVADRAAAELEPDAAAAPEPARAEDLVPVPDRPAEWVVTLLPPEQDYLRAVTPELLEAMCAVMEAVETVRKDSSNDYSHYKYASVDAFFAMIRPLLAKNKLVPIPQLEEVTTTTKHMVQRFAMFLLHVKGGRLGPLRAEAAAPIDMGPQAYGGAQAYAEKFWLRGLFLISAEEPGEDVDSRPKAPLDQRSDPRPAPRPQQRQQSQQRAQTGTTADMPPIAPPPDDADAPGGRIPMRTRGEPNAFKRVTPIDMLKQRAKGVGYSAGQVASYFGLSSMEEMTERQIVEANEVCAGEEKKKGITPPPECVPK